MNRLALAFAVLTVATQVAWTFANHGASAPGDDLALLSQAMNLLRGLEDGDFPSRLAAGADNGTPYPPLVPLVGALASLLFGARLPVLAARLHLPRCPGQRPRGPALDPAHRKGGRRGNRRLAVHNGPVVPTR